MILMLLCHCHCTYQEMTQLLHSLYSICISFIYFVISNVLLFLCSLRKVKMEQRKLNDNANTLVDMAKVSLCLLLLHPACVLYQLQTISFSLKYKFISLHSSIHLRTIHSSIVSKKIAHTIFNLLH